MNKTKEIDKRSKEFLFRHIFKVFANSVSPHSKIWCLRFSNEQNGIIFFIPPVGDLPKIEKCLYLTTAMECNSFNSLFFLSIIKVLMNYNEFLMMFTKIMGILWVFSSMTVWKISIRKRPYTIILYSSQIKKWSSDSSNK